MRPQGCELITRRAGLRRPPPQHPSAHSPFPHTHTHPPTPPKGGAVVGGYNPLGFDGYGPKATLGSFVFTWPDGDFSKDPFKLPKVSTDQMAIVDGLDNGVCVFVCV